ncbi:group 1 glycosyl transferase [Caballeronia catudaia]|uniref:Group 1 glycosyl transferase n=1 Tax=Caballeronia catudaia TaxID=1777136 RepID=A0A158CCM1_9BURK|nr:glycosyltransferase [Caballeronia catudaia]SAK79267.1 group 1 glycosyl transferase [Caballeronia catudaia]
MRKPSVLVYRHQLFKASEPFIHAQASQLQRYRPLYVGRKTSGRAPEDSEVRTIEGASAWDRIANRLWCEPRPFLEALRDDRPAIMHAHFGLDAAYGIHLAQALDIPVIATLHGFDVTVRRSAFALSGKPTEMRYAFSRNAVARGVSRLICVSDFIRSRAIEYGYPEHLLETHYMGIDARPFEPAVWDAQPRRRILHIARLVEKKGTRYLIEAFASLRKRGITDIELDIVGDGPLREDLMDLAKSLRLGDSIQFRGTLSWADAMKLMSTTYLFCLPSVTAKSGDSEGLGMVLLEASAHHIPCVATRHGGIPEAIHDDVNGLLAAERDVDGLAEPMAAILTDAQLHARLATNARRVVERDFDIARQTQKLESIYSAMGGIRQ